MGDTQSASTAWLATAEGLRHSLDSMCSIGRVAGNDIVITGDRVSRRHVLINRRDHGEYWLMDQGSSNGTCLNGRRILQPAKLSDGDSIEVGGHVFAFHQTFVQEPESEAAPASETLREVQSVTCWLLVADMEDSTQFLTRSTAEQFAQLTQQWLSHSREIVEQHGGSVNKFLGDGFFAYWHDGDGVCARVAQTVTALLARSDTPAPHFRIVIHRGLVFTGGSASLGEESLMGSEVHFVFRMEKLAAALGKSALFSTPAAEHLEKLLPLTSIGESHLSGFKGEHSFHVLSSSAMSQPSQ